MVDEKYIEVVRDDEDFEDVMKELGLEGHFEQVGNGIDLEGYEITNLRDMYPDDIYTGRPVISDIYSVEFTNKNTGETVTNWKVDLVLLDDSYEDEKEAYIFTCNLKEENIDFKKSIVKNVYNVSGLYALAMGMAELRMKGISKVYNHLDKVSIKQQQKVANHYSSMTVEVKEKKMVDKKTKEENYYNSFRITDAEE